MVFIMTLFCRLYNLNMDKFLQRKNNATYMNCECQRYWLNLPNYLCFNHLDLCQSLVPVQCSHRCRLLRHVFKVRYIPHCFLCMSTFVTTLIGHTYTWRAAALRPKLVRPEKEPGLAFGLGISTPRSEGEDKWTLKPIFCWRPINGTL